jgi:hypothetical protein
VVTQIHQQVADLLGGPWSVRVRGDTENVHVTGADLHDEQAVQALQRHRAVDVEEISGEHRRSLRMQELPPGRVGVPLRCGQDLQRLEDPADCGRADPVAELEQFALDPLVSPALEMLSSTFPVLCEAGDYVKLSRGVVAVRFEGVGRRDSASHNFSVPISLRATG